MRYVRLRYNNTMYAYNTFVIGKNNVQSHHDIRLRVTFNLLFWINLERSPGVADKPAWWSHKRRGLRTARLLYVILIVNSAPLRALKELGMWSRWRAWSATIRYIRIANWNWNGFIRISSSRIERTDRRMDGPATTLNAQNNVYHRSDCVACWSH